MCDQTVKRARHNESLGENLASDEPAATAGSTDYQVREWKIKGEPMDGSGDNVVRTTDGVASLTTIEDRERVAPTIVRPEPRPALAGLAALFAAAQDLESKEEAEKADKAPEQQAKSHKLVREVRASRGVPVSVRRVRSGAAACRGL